MPLFVIERNFVEQLDPEALDYEPRSGSSTTTRA